MHAPPDQATQAQARRRALDRFSDPPVTVPDLVAEGMTGAEDLATTGTWQTDPVAGTVWSPPVSTDWSPYSDGTWTYEEPWGWTWVDAAPWGFAPYHYGRWTYLRGRWVWSPGARTTLVSYAPALVTFWGSPAAGSVSFAPLGPSETFNGSWMAAPSGALFPTRRVANQNAPNAIHSMSVLDFTSGVQSRPLVVASPEGQLLGSAPMVAPQRESIVIGAARTRPAISNRPLIARTAPPPAPIALNYRLELLKKNQGRPLASKQVAEVRRQMPFAAIQQPTVRYSQPLVAAMPRNARGPRIRPAAEPGPGDQAGSTRVSAGLFTGLQATTNVVPQPTSSTPHGQLTCIPSLGSTSSEQRAEQDRGVDCPFFREIQDLVAAGCACGYDCC